MPKTGENVEVHSGFRFMVKIGEKFSAYFTECTLPNLQVETMDVKEGGQNEFIHKLPVRVNVGTVKLRHGITKDVQLLNWYMMVLEGKIKDATMSVTVTMSDSMGKPIAIWNFVDAYPIKWTGPTLKAGDNAVAIEEIELVHHGFSVQ